MFANPFHNRSATHTTQMAALATALLAAAAFAADPYLGVRMTLHNAEVKVGEQVYPFGIDVVSVVTGSGAADAGLQVGDIIVAVAGLDFAAPDTLIPAFREHIKALGVGGIMELTILRDGVDRTAALNEQPADDAALWADPTEFTRKRDPGTTAQLEIKRVREFRTIRATLGPALVDTLGVREIPANNMIFSDPPKLAEEAALADALIAKHDISEAYNDQRARLARLVERGDAFRLTRFAYAMREPFAMPTLSRDLANAPHTPVALIRHAAQWLDCPLPGADIPPLRTGLSPEEHAEQMEQVLTRAKQHLDAAFAALSDDERNTIRQLLPDVGEAFVESVMVLDHPEPARARQAMRLMELAARVERSALLAAGAELARLVEPGFLAALAADLGEHDGGEFLRRDTPLGPIVFSGRGDAWVNKPAAIYVDLGGDDYYTVASQNPLAVIIDFAGRDQYQSTADAAQAGAVLGVSLLYDGAGDDEYIAQHWGQGAAAFGVGLLIDAAGDDTYRGNDYGQGAALVGVGAVIDMAGDDRYEAPRYAQAIGMPGGFGALLDLAGDDHYYCSGRDKTGYGTDGVFDGWGQGLGIGFRSLSSGGLGLLRDLAGEDVYDGGNFTQGGGYYFGWGALVDDAGDDRYLGSRYAQAFAAHQAIGFFEDFAGNDDYVARRGVGQSCAWDESLTALIDHAGDDRYSGGGFALCASAHNGLALFTDRAGRDTYLQTKGAPRATPNDYHGGTGFSLQLDLGPDEDTHASPSLNNTTAHGDEHGFFIDGEASVTAATRSVGRG